MGRLGVGMVSSLARFEDTQSHRLVQSTEGWDTMPEQLSAPCDIKGQCIKCMKNAFSC